MTTYVVSDSKSGIQSQCNLQGRKIYYRSGAGRIHVRIGKSSQDFDLLPGQQYAFDDDFVGFVFTPDTDGPCEFEVVPNGEDFTDNRGQQLITDIKPPEYFNIRTVAVVHSGGWGFKKIDADPDRRGIKIESPTYNTGRLVIRHYPTIHPTSVDNGKVLFPGDEEFIDSLAAIWVYVEVSGEALRYHESRVTPAPVFTE